MTSLTARVIRTSVLALGVTLLVAGLGTGVLLHVRAHQAVDRALLAAAFAEAHPWQEERFENDYVASPFSVRPWQADDPLIDDALYDEAMSSERPIFVTLGTRRALLLVVEQVGDDSHQHFVVVAEAPAVTAWDVAVPFLLTYAFVASIAAALAGLLIRRGVRSAMAPLYAAARDLEQVQVLGSDARLQRGGPTEVDQLLASANDLLDRLDAAFEAQSSFTAQAAHELRTPVTILKGEIELGLRRQRDATAYREVLERVGTEVVRLEELVEGLMLLARVESGQADRGRESERLSQAVHQAVQRERTTLDAAGCTVNVDLSADPIVSMHVSLMATAIANLLRNAATHAPGAPVEVTVGRENGHACVRVDDGGPGLKDGEHERVLERFARGTTRREGLGLGLPLAREIARRHGGELRLESSVLGGLRAHLELPET